MANRAGQIKWGRVALAAGAATTGLTALGLVDERLRRDVSGQIYRERSLRR